MQVSKMSAMSDISDMVGMVDTVSTFVYLRTSILISGSTPYHNPNNLYFWPTAKPSI